MRGARDDRTERCTRQTGRCRSTTPARSANARKLETGYKGTLRQLDNDYDVANFADALGAYVAEPRRDQRLHYDEQVHAVYGVLSKGVGKFDLQAGLRAEQANTRFDLAPHGRAVRQQLHEPVSRARSRRTTSTTRSQLKLSYSQARHAPDTRQLNPFGFREDALNVFLGNPALRPEYTHAFELGYQQRSARHLQLTPFARHTVNAVRFIRTIDDAGVATTTFQNVATSDSLRRRRERLAAPRPAERLRRVQRLQQVTDGSNLSTDVSNNAFGWSARAQRDAQGDAEHSTCRGS